MLMMRGSNLDEAGVVQAGETSETLSGVCVIVGILGTYHVALQ
jgi:hypothetical protein